MLRVQRTDCAQPTVQHGPSGLQMPAARTPWRQGLRQVLPVADAAGTVIAARTAGRAVLLLGTAPALAVLAWFGAGAPPPSAAGLAWAGVVWLGCMAGVAWLLRRSRRTHVPAPSPDWVAGAVHALRNRLAALGGATEVLAAPVAEPAVRARAQAIAAQQLRQLADLAGNLAELAQAGAAGVRSGPCGRHDLAMLALAALDAQRPQAAAGGKLLLHATQPAPVCGEAHALERALGALLHHALGQLPVRAGLVLEVRAEPPEAVLRLRSDRPAPAQPTRPVPPPEDPDLGLALARCTVARHGGRLSIVDGTHPAIELRLPLQSAADPAERAGVSARRSPGLRLLLVEDVAGVRDSLAAQLSQEGHAVSAQADGEAGLRSLLVEWPDAAVIDLSLPGLTGCALARGARRAGYAGRMVAIAGYGSSPESSEALQAGFDACLHKPVRSSQLRQALAGHG